MPCGGTFVYLCVGIRNLRAAGLKGLKQVLLIQSEEMYARASSSKVFIEVVLASVGKGSGASRH